MENVQQAGISHSLRVNQSSDQEEVVRRMFSGRNIARMLMDDNTADSEVLGLISRGEADLETENPDYHEKWRPLYIAARSSKLAVVKSLIRAGVDITNTNANGEAALHTAVMWGSLDIVKELLAAEVGLLTIGGINLFEYDEDADVLPNPLLDMTNSHGDTALVIACSRGREDILKALLEAGASTKIGNPVLTATANVSEAGESRTIKIVEMLIEYNANPDKWHKGIGPTALFDLVRFNKPLSLVKLLVKNGANLYVRDDRGDTPYSFLVKRYRENSEQLNELRTLAKFPSLQKLSVNSVAKYLHNESDIDELHLPDKRKLPADIKNLFK